MSYEIVFQDPGALPRRKGAAFLYTFVAEWRGRLYCSVGPVSDIGSLFPGGPYRAVVPKGLSEGVVRVDLVNEEDDDGKVTSEAYVSQVLDPAPEQLKLSLPDLPFDTNGEPRHTFPTGFYAVMGRSGAGKSVFLKGWERASGASAILVGEPVPGAFPFSPVAHVRALSLALSGGSRVALIDSLRMATLGGSSLGPGGIPRDMGFQLSQIDYAAKLGGRIILGVINLLTNEERAIESAREILSGSCTGFFDVQAIGSKGVSGIVSFRPEFRAGSSFILKG